MTNTKIDISDIGYNNYSILPSFDGSSKFSIDLISADSVSLDETGFYSSGNAIFSTRSDAFQAIKSKADRLLIQSNNSFIKTRSVNQLFDHSFEEVILDVHDKYKEFSWNEFDKKLLEKTKTSCSFKCSIFYTVEFYIEKNSPYKDLFLNYVNGFFTFKKHLFCSDEIIWNCIDGYLELADLNDIKASVEIFMT